MRACKCARHAKYIEAPHHVVVNFFNNCEKVGEPCVCRLSRVLERSGRELRSLVLAGNKLTQLPASVFELQHLQVL